tara:strand:- start:458 stop:736 length:279 start_codon:yes stop_codon:yes gene_type:complete
VKVGDLVKMKGPTFRDERDPGFVMKVDEQFYGARTAYKIVGAERGQALLPTMVNCIGPTQHGIQDRILVLWPVTGEWEYCYSTDLEVISENK